MKNECWRSASAVCPYYKYQDSRNVYCEGFMPGHMTVQRFARPDLRYRFMQRYCMDDSEGCPAGCEELREAVGYSAELS